MTEQEIKLKIENEKEMKKAAFEILNLTEQREEAIANENYDLSFEFECEQRSYAEALAEMILNIGGKK